MSAIGSESGLRSGLRVLHGECLVCLVKSSTKVRIWIRISCDYIASLVSQVGGVVGMIG